MLKINNLSFLYKNNRVLENLNLECNKGDVIALLGENGVGKSTLIKCILGLEKPQCGDIYLDGHNIKDVKKKDIAKIVSYVPQYIEYDNITVFDAVLLGRIPYMNFFMNENDNEIVLKTLKSLNIENIALKNVNEISGGERQKVAIARALVQSPKILIFDEPTSNLDIKSQMEVINLILEIAKDENLLVIVTMHDINLALSFANKFAFLKDKNIYAIGNEDIINEENIFNVYKTKVKVINIDDKKHIILEK